MNSLCFKIVLVLSVLLTLETFGSDIGTYNSNVNLAELAITQKQYAMAGKYYREAFTENETSAAVDIENAMIAALKDGDKPLALEYAHRLSSLGIGRPYFEKKKIFTSLHSENGWPILLKKAAIEQQKNLQENKDLFAELRQLEVRHHAIIEQSFAPSALENMDALAKEKKSIEDRLQELFTQYGYLTEYKIGLNMVSDTLFGAPLFTEIIKDAHMNLSTHEIYITSNDYFSNVLLEALSQGRVKFEYLTSASMNERVLAAAMRVQYSRCSFYVFQDRQSAMMEIDRARASLGLCTFEQQLIKLKYSISDPDSGFNIGFNVNRYFSSNYSETDPRFLNGSLAIGHVAGCK